MVSFGHLLTRFLVKGLMFIAMIILARWIGPVNFGLVGMIAILISVGKSLTDSGMDKLIRTKNPDHADYSTIFIVNIVISLFVYASVYFAAPLIADFF